MRMHRPATPRSAPSLQLGTAAAELYGDLRLDSMLRKLLDHSGRLLGVVAGSISLVDATQARYTKAAEQGAACQLGQTFSLDEGITGQVASGRRPVVLRSYDQVRFGHLPEDHPARGGAVAAVPIWWLGRVIGVNVAFAGCDRSFTAREVDELELLSQLGAAGIVATGGAAPSLAQLIRAQSRASGQDHVAVLVTEAGVARTTSPDVARAAVELVGRAQLEAGRRTPAGPVRVVVLHRAAGVRLLLHDASTAVQPGPSPTGSWQDVVASSGGAISVQGVPGWGVLVRADLPHPGSSVQRSGLTPREQEVLALLAEGLTDRQVADALQLSHKTVEKHVGAVLRKTGTTSRTAAVMRALHRDWLPAPRRAEPG